MTGAVIDVDDTVDRQVQSMADVWVPAIMQITIPTTTKRIETIGEIHNGRALVRPHHSHIITCLESGHIDMVDVGIGETATAITIETVVATHRTRAMTAIQGTYLENS